MSHNLSLLATSLLGYDRAFFAFAKDILKLDGACCFSTVAATAAVHTRRHNGRFVRGATKVRLLIIFFCFHFVKKIIDLSGGQINDPSSGDFQSILEESVCLAYVILDHATFKF